MIFIDTLLMLYYIFCIPLVMFSIFLYRYRFGFDRIGLKSAFQRCIMWIISSTLFLIIAIYYFVPSVPDNESQGLGDGILLMMIIFPGLIIITLGTYVVFMCGYIKNFPEGYVSKNKPLNRFMVILNMLCLFVLFSGVIISYERSNLRKFITHQISIYPQKN